MIEGNAGTTLLDAANLASWRSPDANQRGGEIADPTKVLSRIKAGHQINLNDQAVLTSWFTPAARDWKDTPGMAVTGIDPDGTTRTRIDQLPRQVQLADLSGWATPVATELGNTLENYQRMKAHMRSGPRTAITHPSLQVQLAHWPTPQVDSFRSRGGDRKDEMGLDQMARSIPVAMQVRGMPSTGSPAAITSGGQLNPAHSRWLMGFPVLWDDCAKTALQKR